MNILIISPFLPFKEDNGSKIRTMNFIKAWDKNKVYLFAFYEKEDEINTAEIQRYCTKAWLYKRPSISFLKILLNYFSLKPLLSLRFYKKEFHKQLKKIVLNYQINAMLIESLLMAEYGENIGKVFRILDEHNIEFMRAKRRYESERNILKKIYYFLIYLRLKRYELKTISKFDSCIVCSAEDESEIVKNLPSKDPVVIPNAVNTEYFSPLSEDKKSNRIVFVGTIWYEPNLDAVRFFIQDIFPLIKNKVGDVEFWVIGEFMEKDIVFFREREYIKFFGHVEDIRTFLKDALVFVAPLRMGSGTRLKILTSMAMGIPVVSTTIGCEGLEVEDEEDIFIANTPDEFADKVIKLIKDEKLRKKIAINGRNLVKEKYSREKIIELIKAYFKSLSFSL